MHLKVKDKDVHQTRRLRRLARAEASEQQRVIAEDRAHAQSAIRILRTRMAELSAERQPAQHMRACQLDDQDLDLFGIYFVCLRGVALGFLANPALSDMCPPCVQLLIGRSGG